jgi:hypothetical protein
VVSQFFSVTPNNKKDMNNKVGFESNDEADLTSVDLRQRLERRLTKEAVDSALAYVLKFHPVMWGEKQGREFDELNVLMVMYHDVAMVGYQRLVRRIKAEFKPSDK